jgi:hypothetical protein
VERLAFLVGVIYGALAGWLLGSARGLTGAWIAAGITISAVGAGVVFVPPFIGAVACAAERRLGAAVALLAVALGAAALLSYGGVGGVSAAQSSSAAPSWVVVALSFVGAPIAGLGITFAVVSAGEHPDAPTAIEELAAKGRHEQAAARAAKVLDLADRIPADYVRRTADAAEKVGLADAAAKLRRAVERPR